MVVWFVSMYVRIFNLLINFVVIFSYRRTEAEIIQYPAQIFILFWIYQHGRFKVLLRIYDKYQNLMFLHTMMLQKRGEKLCFLSDIS